MEPQLDRDKRASRRSTRAGLGILALCHSRRNHDHLGATCKKAPAISAQNTHKILGYGGIHILHELCPVLLRRTPFGVGTFIRGIFPRLSF